MDYSAPGYQTIPKHRWRDGDYSKLDLRRNSDTVVEDIQNCDWSGKLAMRRPCKPVSFTVKLCPIRRAEWISPWHLTQQKVAVITVTKPDHASVALILTFYSSFTSINVGVLGGAKFTETYIDRWLDSKGHQPFG